MWEARLAADPADIEALNNLTRYAIGDRDYAAAMARNQAAMEAAPEDVEARTLRAVLSARMGLSDRASELLDAVLEDDPGFAMAWAVKASVHMELGEGPEAVVAFERALAIQDDPMLRAGLERAKQLTSGGTLPAPGPESAPETPATGPLLSGTISLGDGASEYAATDVLYVAVRSLNPGPPLAALRLSPGPFPLEFQVNPSDLISMGGMSRPFPDTVNVTARIDRDGNAMTREQGLPAGGVEGVAKGSDGLQIVLQ